MKIVEINSGSFGSTGSIMKNIATAAENAGHEVYCFCAKSRSSLRVKNGKNVEYIGTILSRNIHFGLSIIFPVNGCLSVIDTLRFIYRMKQIEPNVIHLHNIHNCYINIPLLVRYIKKNNLRVIWTLHDCWSFTGHCAYYDLIGCNKWITGCANCPAKFSYPSTIIDDSKTNYRRKKKWFTVIDMTLITPSEWLAGEVKKSFLKKHNTIVVNNGIDLNRFRPISSNIREQYNCKEKIILLGVALGWGKRKGIDTFVQLADRLDNRFQIVLVGISKADVVSLPTSIITISRTESIDELAKLYTTADVFVNPTMEENFPTVNLEALACGTPIVTFDTGGSAEMLTEETGIVIQKGDVDALERAILKIADGDIRFDRNKCRKQAEKYSLDEMNSKYVALFESLYHS